MLPPARFLPFCSVLCVNHAAGSEPKDHQRPRPVAAEPKAPRQTEPSPEKGAPAPGPVLASVFPGVVLHGAGSWTAGRKRAGYRLLAMEGAGLGMILVGGATLGLTGANRTLVGPAAALTIGGFGLFFVSWLADIHSVSSGKNGTGRQHGFAPRATTAFGYRYVYDPQFEYRNFFVQSVDLRMHRIRATPSGWFAAEDANARLRLEGAYRFAGPLPGAAASDGSFVDLEMAVTHHAYPRDGFRRLTGEVFVEVRLDLDRVDPSFAGSFAEMGVGWAYTALDLDAPGHDLGDDAEDLLLFRHGFGVYFGGPAAPDGEVALHYDHRHDDYVAGLKLRGIGSGAAGHFVLQGRAFVTENWGLSVDARAGSAYVLGLSLLHRHGATE